MPRDAIVLVQRKEVVCLEKFKQVSVWLSAQEGVGTGIVMT